MADMTAQQELDLLRKKVAELEAANANLHKGSHISFKVSEKGALSMYGLQRFPVTLYVEQWERILSVVGELKGFIAANKETLTRKPVPAKS